jgi:hypothetical protein
MFTKRGDTYFNSYADPPIHRLPSCRRWGYLARLPAPFDWHWRDVFRCRAEVVVEVVMNLEGAPGGACGGDSIPLGDSLRGGMRSARLRYQMYVMGADVADAVRNVAGLMTDRARLGWDVTAGVIHASDMRPIRVLGARHEDIAVTSEERSSTKR